MRKSLLGVIVGVGMMFAQCANAADMVRYDKSASNIQPEQTVAQLQMDGNCMGPHCHPCIRQCPPRHCHHRHHHHRKACHSHKQHHHKHKHAAKAQQGTAPRGHNESIEEKKMSSDRSYPAARKTSYQGNNSETYVEEYIDEVGREHR